MHSSITEFYDPLLEADNDGFMSESQALGLAL